jgi:sortase (surface protein transpeptidase)
MADEGRHADRRADPGQRVTHAWPGWLVVRLRGRPALTVAVAIFCAAVGLSSLAYATGNHAGAPQGPAPSAPHHGAKTPAHRAVTRASVIRGPVMARSVPVHLDIPSVDIDTDLLRLGLNADGTLQVPWRPLLAGWYVHSPTPGEPGPAVIAGHVDSWATGPAVFYRLGQLAVGSRVQVTRADASHAVFVVTAVRSYPKSTFPTHRVYGDVDRAELRLITCGTWNDHTQEYDDNVVVFARLVQTRSSTAGGPAAG